MVFQEANLALKSSFDLHFPQASSLSTQQFKKITFLQKTKKFLWLKEKRGNFVDCQKICM